MPSNRAVLADIKNNGLDPSKAHKTLSSSGRLKTPSAPSTVSAPIVEPLVVEHTVTELPKVTEVIDVQKPKKTEPRAQKPAKVKAEKEGSPEPVEPNDGSDPESE